MAPTIRVNDLVLVDRNYYRDQAVTRGDVVMISAADSKMIKADGPGAKYLFRVIGLAGDSVQVLAGKVFVNGRLLSGAFARGEYETKRPIKDVGPILVPSGEYFLVGDNLPNSYDSRDWSHPTIGKNLIEGKVLKVRDAKTADVRSLSN
jgi:signal peptidase I